VGTGLHWIGIATASALALLSACDGTRPACPAPAAGPAAGWPAYGNDPGGTRYSPLADVTPDNVQCLEEAWTYSTGDLPDARGEHPSTLASEVTPILADGTLYLCTPYNRVVALDPETGAERWTFDPDIDLDGRYANQLVCRGVSTWLDAERAAGEACRRRVFTATNDARLIALDARDGRPCADFGDGGEVDLNPGVGRQEWRGEYQVTSPPAVGEGLVVVGSAVSDNARSDAPSGVVRAYDARSGALRWAFDLRPPGFVATPENTSDAGYALATPNVWAPMAVDRERELVFVPTGNPSPDYFRGDSDLDFYGSSVLALRLATGEVVWRFQTVHRDLWDYDVPAQPTLFDLQRGDQSVPALVQATKMGLLFVLHRETGAPLFPVEERPVPQDPALGERLSPTQPFPLAPPPLVPHALGPEDAFGITPWDRGRCRERLASLRTDGIYTPPTVEGTLAYPGNAGGSNWGGVAVDEDRQWLVANTQSLPWEIALVPRDSIDAQSAKAADLAPMRGTPYLLHRELMVGPLGVPCNPPPWGELARVDLSDGSIAWQVPLGTLRDLAPVPVPPITLGIPNLGGPLLTGGGLVFIGAALDRYLRAFDAESGEEVWRERLPTPAQATPMTYRVRDGGRQFLVVAAMGYGRAGTAGDTLIAYALPEGD